MAAMPIYGKTLFSGTKRPLTLKLDMQHRVFEYYQVCSNDDPGFTLTYFTTRSNLVPDAFVWGRGKTMDFSETIVVYDVKVGRCSQLNMYMNLHVYMHIKGQDHSLTLVQGQSDSTLSNFFSLETAGPVEAKISDKASMGCGMKDCSNGPSHLTNMA